MLRLSFLLVHVANGESLNNAQLEMMEQSNYSTYQETNQFQKEKTVKQQTSASFISVKNASKTLKLLSFKDKTFVSK